MQDDRIDLVFKALAHPERRRILAFLHAGPGRSLFEICVSPMDGAGPILSRQTISQHLDMLEKAGLVETAWQGRTKIHSANLDPLRQAADLVIQPYL